MEHNSFGTKYENCSNGTYYSFRTIHELNLIREINLIHEINYINW